VPDSCVGGKRPQNSKNQWRRFDQLVTSNFSRTTGLNSIASSVFRSFSKITKSDYQLRHVCTFVCPHGTTRLPLHGFSWNL